MSSSAASIPAGPLRRLGAMVYDTLLIAAILMVATLPFVFLANGRALNPKESGVLAYLYWFTLLAIIAVFFGYFWTRNGRTLGMQAWRLRIEALDGELPSWSDALKRVAMAWMPIAVVSIGLSIAERFVFIDVAIATLIMVGVALLNYLSAYLQRDRRAWHERWLRTRIVRA
jgi:uncharacterized RDD family membrane protein YckC